MKRTGVAVSVVLMVMALAVPAIGDEHIPPHGHLMLVRAEFEGEGPSTIIHSYARCVDLAANQALRLNAHHDHVHFGTAGQALRTAGQLIVPAEPFGPFADCADLEESEPPG